MRKITLSLATVFILLSSFTANAVLNMGGKTIFTGTVIEVLEPGPATQIQAMITNITDATGTKPYLIHLGPGVYDLGTAGIVMKEWVSIQGSGQKATKITGAVSTANDDATSAIVSGANNAALTDLSIENTGGSVNSMAIYNNIASPRIERVTATASGGTVNNSVRNQQSSSPTMIDVTAVASGGTDCYGVLNAGSSSPVMTNITASASDGAFNAAIANFSSSPVMTNVTAKASTGENNYGVFNFSSSPVMTNVTATGLGTGADNFGVQITGLGSPFIQNSIIEGGTNGIFIGSNPAGTRIVNSKIIGGVDNQASGTQCRGNYDVNLVDVNC